MSGEILTQRRRDAECAEAIVARAPDVARAPSPLQQGRGGLATSCTFGFAIASEVLRSYRPRNICWSYGEGVIYY